MNRTGLSTSLKRTALLVIGVWMLLPAVTTARFVTAFFAFSGGDISRIVVLAVVELCVGVSLLYAALRFKELANKSPTSLLALLQLAILGATAQFCFTFSALYLREPGTIALSLFGIGVLIAIYRSTHRELRLASSDMRVRVEPLRVGRFERAGAQPVDPASRAFPDWLWAFLVLDAAGGLLGAAISGALASGGSNTISWILIYAVIPGFMFGMLAGLVIAVPGSFLYWLLERKQTG